MKWYRSTNENRGVTQLILEVPAGNSREPEFGLLVLPGKYSQVITNPVVAGFFRMSSDPLPYLMARADGCVADLRDRPFRIAYSFYHLPSGGIFGAFLEFDSPELAKASPTGFPILEMTYGLDMDETRQLIREGATRSPAHVVFTRGSSGNTYVSYDASTGRESEPASMPECEFDRVFDLPAVFLIEFQKELDALLNHHRRCSNADYHRSLRELCERFPVSENPILAGSETAISRHKSQSGPALRADTTTLACGPANALSLQSKPDSASSHSVNPTVWALAGGGVFFALNLITHGVVPGGAIGGMIGGAIGALLAAIVNTIRSR